MSDYRYLRLIAFMLLISILPILSGCQYYGKKAGTNEKAYVLDEGQRLISRNYTFFLHIDNKTAQFEEAVFNRFDDSILGQLTMVDESKVASFKEMSSRSFVRYSGSAKSDAKQVHIYVSSYEDLGDGKVKIKGSNIEKVDVYAINGAVTTLASLGVAALTYVGTIIVFLIIFCSCPHIYTWDGESYVFSSTLFTGAINKQLAREDYKVVPDFFPGESSVKLQIRNDDHEKQYIDHLRMDVVLHDKDQAAYVNQAGEYILVEEEVTATEVVGEKGNLLPDQLSYKDDLMYDFDAVDSEGFSHLYLRFNDANIKSDKLLLRLKNAKWGGMAYKDMTQLFGHRYDDWRERNSAKSKQEMRIWLKDQKLNLEIEQLVHGAWQPVEEIEMVGDEIFAEYYVEVEPNQPLEFRMTTGFKFWDLDYVAMAKGISRPAAISLHEPEGEEVLDLLSRKDGKYCTLLEKGKVVDIQFTDIPIVENRKRSLFLVGDGYYESNHTYDTRTRYAKLLPFRKAGELSKFSKELYENYQSSVQVTYSQHD